MTLQAGLTGSVERVVADEHTAIARRSGDVAVLATPELLAWCEEATVAATADSLEPGQTAVGMRIRLDHTRATAVGVAVSIEARLSLVEGRRLTFDVHAEDNRGEVATGQIIRVVVDRDRFLQRTAH